ncbi:MAG: site-2 protease family protein [Archaeoglobaceae archaeon]
MRLEDYFLVYNAEKIKDGMRYYVIPRARSEEIEQFLLRLSYDYNVTLRERYGELILEVKRLRERKIVNVALFIATFISTTFFGSMLYGEPNLVGGVLFSFAILFVLGSHEMAHFFVAKRWKMRVSLPYFIPFPTIIGTLGAVIKQRGAIPSRRALLELGASGPIVGFFASIIVTLVGLRIPFEFELKGNEIMLGTSLIFDLTVAISGFDGLVIHPIAFAGWVGFLLTFFNLLPVGQLDGGHVMRAMIGEKSEVVSRTTPIILLLLAPFFGAIWIFWAMVLFFFSMQRHPKPMNDERLDFKGLLLGISCYAIAILCFTPTPFSVWS